MQPESFRLNPARRSSLIPACPLQLRLVPTETGRAFAVDGMQLKLHVANFDATTEKPRRCGCRIAKKATARTTRTYPSPNNKGQKWIGSWPGDNQQARLDRHAAEFGIEHFTVGLEPYLKVIEDEYLDGS